jgi:hypothetical protein
MPSVSIPVAVGAAATVGGAVISSNATGNAAKTQANAADQATQLQSDIYQQNRTDLAPWRQTGSNALSMLANAVGINGPQGNAQATAAFQTSPGYDFAFNQGTRAVNSNQAASGMLRSGAAAKALTDYGTGMANQEFGNWTNRLATLAGFGQNANSQQQQAGQQFGQATGTNLANAAQARASGYMGQAGAITGATNQAAGLYANYGGTSNFSGANTGAAYMDPTSGNYVPGAQGF